MQVDIFVYRLGLPPAAAAHGVRQESGAFDESSYGGDDHRFECVVPYITATIA